MVLPVINNVTRVFVSGTNENGLPWGNVLHFNHATGYGDHAANVALATKLDKLYAGPAYAGSDEGLIRRCNNALKLNSYTFTPLDGSTASDIVLSTKSGGDAAQGTPPEISQVLTLYSTLRGRRYRGRVFLPNWCIDAYDSAGIPGATILVNVVAQGTAFLADIVTVDWTWVIASYKYAAKINVATVAMHPVTAAQRRRRGRYP